MSVPQILTRRNLEEDLAFVERQLEQLRDPYDTIRLMWEQRRDALKEELGQVEAKPNTRANVALIFDGNPVRGSEDIRVDFATKALDNYQMIISSLMAERAGAEVRSRGKLPSAFSSKLFIRDMMRGSVGFILEEPSSDQSELVGTPLHDTVEEATRIFRDLSASENAAFEERVTALAPRTLDAIKKMAKVLHDAGAETTIVGDTEEFSLDQRTTASLYTRLNELEVTERSEKREGHLLGLFPERRQYEFRPSDGSPVFYGPVSEVLDTKYLSDPNYATSILLKSAIARFNVVSTLRGGVVKREQWILEDIDSK
jgi:hypothetical protein